MSSFELASTIEPIGEGRFSVQVPDGWQQGRGAFGGLVLATLLRAIERSEPDPLRKTRTLVGDLVGPVQPGPGEIVVTALRRGSNQTNFRAEFLQAGEVVAHAAVVSSKARKLDPVARTAPARPPAHEVAVVPMDLGPRFAQHYDFRNVGPVPFGAGAETYAAGYVREKEPPSAVDAPALIALLDVWWPSFFTTSDRVRLGATVSFTAEIVCDPSTIDPTAPLFATGRGIAAYEGFFVELRELWEGDRLVALNQQTFAVMG